MAREHPGRRIEVVAGLAWACAVEQDGQQQHGDRKDAGITRDDLIMRLSDEDWRDVIDTNLGGAFFTCRALSRPMLKRRR